MSQQQINQEPAETIPLVTLRSNIERVLPRCCCDVVLHKYILTAFALVGVALGIIDCVSDWKLYFERDRQVENICEEASTEIHSGTKMALNAMLAFVIFGTILVSLETINALLGMCKQKIMHPVFLSIVVCLLEELPLAGLRWNLKTSANNEMADGWGIVSAIGSMTAPLFSPIYKCCKMFGCSGSPDETCCDELCSGARGKSGAACLILMVLVIVTLNALNWAEVEAPGAELCV